MLKYNIRWRRTLALRKISLRLKRFFPILWPTCKNCKAYLLSKKDEKLANFNRSMIKEDLLIRFGVGYTCDKCWKENLLMIFYKTRTIKIKQWKRDIEDIEGNVFYVVNKNKGIMLKRHYDFVIIFRQFYIKREKMYMCETGICFHVVKKDDKKYRLIELNKNTAEEYMQLLYKTSESLSIFVENELKRIKEERDRISRNSIAG